MSRVRRDRNKNRKNWALAFVFVSIFCAVFFADRGRFEPNISSQAVSLTLSPFEQAVSWVGSQLRYALSNIYEIATVHQQNKMLKSEIDQLRILNLQASEYAAENARLRALLGYKQTATQFDLVAARVIGRESATWSSMITINRGQMEGITKDMPVVTEKGLVGKVTEAGLNSSKVQLILDPRSSVGTLVQRAESRVAGIVEGDFENFAMPRMVNIPMTADVVEDDVIITSGFGGIFPKGIVVGKIAAIKHAPGGLLKYGVIEPAVDFQKLEDVEIIVKSREAPPEPLPPVVDSPSERQTSTTAAAKGATR